MRVSENKLLTDNIGFMKENNRLINRAIMLEAKEFKEIIKALRIIISEVREDRWYEVGFFTSLPDGIKKIRDILRTKNYDERLLNMENFDNPHYYRDMNAKKLLDLAKSIHEIVLDKVQSSCATRSEELQNFYIRSNQELTRVMRRFDTAEVKKIDRYEERLRASYLIFNRK